MFYIHPKRENFQKKIQMFTNLFTISSHSFAINKFRELSYPPQVYADLYYLILSHTHEILYLIVYIVLQ